MNIFKNPCGERLESGTYQMNVISIYFQGGLIIYIQTALLYGKVFCCFGWALSQVIAVPTSRGFSYKRIAQIRSSNERI